MAGNGSILVPPDEAATVRNEAAMLILRPAVAKMIEALGPVDTAHHLALALAGTIAGGGPAFAFQLLHFAHIQTEVALSQIPQNQTPQGIIRPS